MHNRRKEARRWAIPREHSESVPVPTAQTDIQQPLLWLRLSENEAIYGP